MGHGVPFKIWMLYCWVNECRCIRSLATNYNDFQIVSICLSGWKNNEFSSSTNIWRFSTEIFDLRTWDLGIRCLLVLVQRIQNEIGLFMKFGSLYTWFITITWSPYWWRLSLHFARSICAWLSDKDSKHRMLWWSILIQRANVMLKQCLWSNDAL